MKDHLVHSEDRIDRRADLVRHIRKEVALRLVCRIREPDLPLQRGGHRLQAS